MSANCCHHCEPNDGGPAFRRALWIVLAINAVMFAVEIGAGMISASASLQADALDFLGDAANYGISLLVVGMALRYRAAAALVLGGLAASGETVLDGLDHLDRGYDRMTEKLAACGAAIVRSDG